jgi:hypothetical protein
VLPSSPTPAPPTPDDTTSLPPTPQPALAFRPVRGIEQDVTRTASRRTQPRPWLRAVTWLVSSGVHPKAGSTTLALADDLAQRMDYQRGIVLYDLDGTARRLGLSVATVKRHAAVLRELGALVWLVHGSKRNLRLPGRKYTATATVYGAVIPPLYDRAMGHKISGTGYEARVTGFTPTGRHQATEASRNRSAMQRASRTGAAQRREPHSLATTPHISVPVVGGKQKATHGRNKAVAPRKSILGRKVTASAYATADRLARILRPLHNWIQPVRIPELSWVLLDKVIDGCDEYQIDTWLRTISPRARFSSRWNSHRPHAYIATQLLLDDQLRREAATRENELAHRTTPNPAFTQATAELRHSTGADAEREPALALNLGSLDQEDIAALRAAAWQEYRAGDIDLVTTSAENLGIAATERIYGHELVQRTLQLAFNARIRTHGR